MRLKVIIDDFTPIFQPLELEEFELKISYDIQGRTFLVETNDTELTFVGDAYNYLYNSRQKNGFNSVHNVDILLETNENIFRSIFKGKLFLADCKFDLDKSQVSVEIIDVGYSSFIRNNKDIETNIAIAKSKNFETLNEIQTRTINLINPPSATTPGIGMLQNQTDVYPIDLVFEFLVGFMSDNELSFKSEYFDKWKSELNTNFGIVKGYSLRNNTVVQSEQNISFNQLFQDVARLFNLTLSTEINEGIPRVRIEGEEYLKNSQTAFSIQNKTGIKRSFVQEFLNSKITLGSKDAIIDGSYGNLTYLPPYDFNKDTYYINGNANVDKTLDLTLSTLITDSNIIEKILVDPGSDEYDDNWFIIAYNEITGNVLTDSSDIFKDGNYYYNAELTNKEVVLRYNIQGAAVKTLGEPGEVFTGRQGSNISKVFNTATNAYFNNVQYDPSGGWNTSTNRYTATTSGVRNVSLDIDLQVIYPPNIFAYTSTDDVDGYIIEARFKVNGVYLKRVIGLNTQVFPPTPIYEYIGAAGSTFTKNSTTSLVATKTLVAENIFLAAGDYLEIEYIVTFGFLRIAPFNLFPQGKRTILMSSVPPTHRTLIAPYLGWTNGTFEFLSATNLKIETTDSVNGFSIQGNVNPNFFIDRFEFEETLSSQNIINILQNPQQSIKLINFEHGINTNTWVYNLNIKPLTGNTNFDLINNLVD